MKLSIFLSIVVACCLLLPAEAQVKDIVDEDTVYNVLDQQAKFPGGLEEMFTFLEKNINYPETARRLRIQGTVFVSFIVNKDGSLSEIKIVKGIHVECDKEAIRVVSISPKWIPGVQAGEVVRSGFVWPIKFRFPR